jgi:hypothetical protein
VLRLLATMPYPEASAAAGGLSLSRAAGWREPLRPAPLLRKALHAATLWTGEVLPLP